MELAYYLLPLCGYAAAPCIAFCFYGNWKQRCPLANMARDNLTLILGGGIPRATELQHELPLCLNEKIRAFGAQK